MRTLRLFLALTVICAIVQLSAGSAHAAEERFISIGTGGVTGVYYPTGSAICRLINKERKSHGIRCSVEATPGSVFNSQALRAGKIDFAVIQSDVQYRAFEGVGEPFAEQGPFADMRAVFSVYPEPFTVVAHKDAGIEQFEDLKGKRVNIGNPGSGQRNTFEVVIKAMGWTLKDFSGVLELKTVEQAQALCNREVDAIVFTVGHPNGSIREATTSCAANLVPVTGTAIDALVADMPYYRKAAVPAHMYNASEMEIPTFGVAATLVTTSETPDDLVRTLVQAVFRNFENFKRLHPAFSMLKPEEMAAEGLSAPLHPAALEFYKSQGWK